MFDFDSKQKSREASQRVQQLQVENENLRTTVSIIAILHRFNFKYSSGFNCTLMRVTKLLAELMTDACIFLIP